MKLLKEKSGKYIFWKIEDDSSWSEFEAMELQKKEGYNPAGYFFNGYNTVKVGDKFLTSWYCYASCD